MAAVETTAAEDMSTAGAAAKVVESRLKAAGAPSPRLDALVLVGAALGLDANAVRLRPDRPLDTRARARLQGFAERRAAAREPISRILGKREFWSLPFRLSADTLDPRPDSECLVEAALRRIPDRAAPLSVLDLGAGTGCLLLALLSELPNAEGLGIDASAGAVATARENADLLGLGDRARFRAGDWTTGIGPRYHWILCNPPYIRTRDIDRLSAEVRHDPCAALDGGADGLDAYRSIAPQISPRLADGGGAAVEVGDGQAEAVGRLFEAAGLEVEAVEADLTGRARCVVVRAAADR